METVESPKPKLPLYNAGSILTNNEQGQNFIVMAVIEGPKEKNVLLKSTDGIQSLRLNKREFDRSLRAKRGVWKLK